MPAKQQVSPLSGKLKKYNVDKVHAQHKDDEVKFSAGGDLPGGIEGGIAKVKELVIGTYKEGKNAGECFFRAMAVVESPPEFKGCQTRIGPEPLCETPDSGGKRKTFDDHYSWVLNEIKKLGDDAKAAISEMSDPETELPVICEMLAKAGVYIRFRTWQGEATPQFPNPRVNHDWRGKIDGYVSDTSTDDGVTDSSPRTEKTTETPAKKTVVSKSEQNGSAEKSSPVKKSAKKVSFEDQELSEVAQEANNGNVEAQTYLENRAKDVGIEEDDISNAADWTAVVDLINEVGTDSTEDLDTLAANADSGDEESQQRISELASESGIDPDDYATWTEVVEMLKSSNESQDEWKPAVGEVYPYKWFDKKTGKPSTKATECEVIKVDDQKRTVSLKNLTNNQVIQSIKWSEIQD